MNFAEKRSNFNSTFCKKKKKIHAIWEFSRNFIFVSEYFIYLAKGIIGKFSKDMEFIKKNNKKDSDINELFESEEEFDNIKEIKDSLALTAINVWILYIKRLLK